MVCHAVLHFWHPPSHFFIPNQLLLNRYNDKPNKYSRKKKCQDFCGFDNITMKIWQTKATLCIISAPLSHSGYPFMFSSIHLQSICHCNIIKMMMCINLFLSISFSSIFFSLLLLLLSFIFNARQNKRPQIQKKKKNPYTSQRMKETCTEWNQLRIKWNAFYHFSWKNNFFSSLLCVCNDLILYRAK